MKKMLKISAITVCALILVSAVMVVTVSYIQARAFVGPFHNSNYVSPSDYGLDYENINLTTDDGLKLKAWYIPSRNRAAIILLHGLYSNRRDMLPIAEMLARHDYGAILVDMRSRGMSEGNQFSFGKYEVRDVDAALRYLQGRSDLDSQRIGALGQSIGGVVILLHYEQNPGIKAAVADSAFASLKDEVETGVKAFSGLPSFPFATLIQWFAERRMGFPASDIAPIVHIRAISPRPVFFIQGGKDTQIPPDSGQRLYNAAGEPRQLWFDPQMRHTEFVYSRPKEYEKRIVGFFDQYLLGK